MKKRTPHPATRMGLSILAGGMAFVGSAGATDLIVNGSFELNSGGASETIDGTAPGWDGVVSTYYSTYSGITGPQIPAEENPGNFFTWYQQSAVGAYQQFTTPAASVPLEFALKQTVNLTSAVKATDIDSGNAQYTFSTWMANYSGNPESPYVVLRFLDNASNPVGTDIVFDRTASTHWLRNADPNDMTPPDASNHFWSKYSQVTTVPVGARKATVYVTRSPNAGLSGRPDTYVDLVKLDVVGTVPTLTSANPGDGSSGVLANAVVTVTLNDQTTAVDTNTIQLLFDGNPVVPLIGKAGGVTTVQYDPPGLLPSFSSHTYKIIFGDNGGTPFFQTNQFAFTVASYVGIPASYAKPVGSANTPGFLVRTVIKPAGGSDLPNSIARANAQLAGTLIDPNTGLPYANEAAPGPNPDGSYNVDTTINFEQAATAAGDFTGDVGFPGLPLGDNNNLAEEILCYIPLSAGYYRFGVNSDDGFEVSVGTPPQSPVAPRTVLGAYDGGRGASDTLFDFTATADGVYCFRVVYFEGNGGASLEFFSVDIPTGEKILVNDSGNPKSIPAYRALTGVAQPPYVRVTTPAAGAVDVKVDTIISADIWDGATALNNGTVQMLFNDAPVTVTLAPKVGVVTPVSYQPPSPLAYRSTNNVTLIFGDGTTLVTNKWLFVTRGAEQAPGITGHWNFDNGDLSATIGLPLEYFGGAGSPSALQTQFGTTTSFGIPDIQGVSAHVMRAPRASTTAYGYVMRHGATPNGGSTATKVNQWTMIMDILIPDPGWFSFCQIDSPSNSGDGDLFVDPGNGIGISGSYQGSVTRGVWHRVAFSVDAASVISKFVDGVKAADQTGWSGAGFDGRHALLPTTLLFADEDGESQVCYVKSIQIRNYKMRDAEIAALGGPHPDGVSTVSGQWDFTDTTFPGALTATLGTDMQLLDGTEFNTVFESVPFGAGNANVMHFLANPNDGYRIYHGGQPNAGGQFVNQYSLLMDVFWPTASNGKWRSLFQTSTNNANDGDLFINNNNGLGISSTYAGNILPETWYRLAFTFNLTNRVLSKYTNGVLAGQQTLGEGVDGRWSLASGAFLFTDEDGETAEGFVNSVQFHPLVLSPEQIAKLGRPAAAGLPVQLPIPLQITGVVDLGLDLQVTWAGGVGPFTVQTRESLSTGDWADALVTDQNTAVVGKGPDTLFIRIVGQ